MTKTKASVPPIDGRKRFALPIILPPDEYVVQMMEPVGDYAKISDRPYVKMRCIVLEGPYTGRSVWFTYFMAIPGLPNDEDEIAKFKPLKARVEVGIRDMPDGTRDKLIQFNTCRFMEIIDAKDQKKALRTPSAKVASARKRA